MALPRVTVEQTNGNLGNVAPSTDGITLIIVTGVVDGDVSALDAVYGPFYSLADAEAAGFTETYDDDNSVMAWHQIRDFYADENNTPGTETYVLPVADTVLLSDMVDKDGTYGGVYAQLNGKIRQVCASRIPDGAYTPTYTDGIENDIITAIANAKALRTYEQSQQRPLQVVLEGRNVQTPLSSLKDMRAADGPNAAGVMLVIDQDKSVADKDAAYAKYARAGYAAGIHAGLPVQRDSGRVKNGPVKLYGDAYLSDGSSKIEELDPDTVLGPLHDKGYVFLRQHVNKPGFYYNRSNSCTPLTDDYRYYPYSRVADKADRIANDVYTDEILDDIILNEDGTLPAPTIKDFQGKLEAAVLAQMPGEISSITVFCDPKQNVGTTDKIIAQMNLTPVGYAANIEVPLAFVFNAS